MIRYFTEGYALLFLLKASCNVLQYTKVNEVSFWIIELKTYVEDRFIECPLPPLVLYILPKSRISLEMPRMFLPLSKLIVQVLGSVCHRID